MDQITRKHFDTLQSKDAQLRYLSFQYIIKATEQPVEWAYEVWDDILNLAKDGDNHQRSIAAQLLSNLAKSDPKKRMMKDIDKLFAVTKDEKFVTARHSLQSLWKVAIASPELNKEVIKRLADRFKKCIAEKNCTLVRYDIMVVLRKVFDQKPGEELKKLVPSLIALEKDSKYRKKYTGVWKDLLEGNRKSK